MSETDQRDWWLTAADDTGAVTSDIVPRAVLDAITDPFYVYDRYGNLVEYNDAFREMSGYSDAELAEFDPIQLVAPPDRERVVAGLARVADGEEMSMDIAFEPKDGHRNPYEVTASPLRNDDGEVVALVGTARDISERKERERQLEQHERVIETVGDGVYILDNDRRFAQVNQAFADMLGYSREELVGMRITDILTQEGVTVAEQYREFVAESDRTVVAFENEVVRADGEMIPVETRFSRMPESDEYVTLGLVRDIRDRRERGQLLQRLHEGTRDLMAAETVTEVAETAAEVAHDHFDFATTGVRLLRDGRLEMVSVESNDPDIRGPKPSYEVGEGFVGEVYEQGEANVFPDLSAVEREYDYDPIQSAMILPIDGWGTISISARERDAFDDIDLDLARLFAADVELAFARAAREERVREQNRQLKQYERLVETMSDGAYMTDGERRIQAVNDAFADLWGYDREELLGRPVTELLSESAAAEADERLGRLLDTDESVAVHETTITTGDGDEVPVEARFSLLPSADGFAGEVGVVRNVTEREKRDRELQNAKERLQMALEGAELGVWDWHVQSSEVTFNDRWAEMLGFAPDEIEDSYETWKSLVHPGDIDRAEAALKRHLDGETEYYRSEYRMRTKDGDWRWIRDLGRAFERDDDGNAVRLVGVHWDVTDRRERERELQATKDRLELAFEGAELGLWDWHIPSDDITINDRWAEMHGYDPSEIEDPYDTWTDLVHPDDLPAAKEAVNRNIVGETDRFESEYRVRTKDGEQRWMRDHGRVVERDDDGRAVRAIGVHLDVTDRKEREQRLRRQRDELETLNRINELVQETIGALASVASREEIEATVCERLGGSSLYRFACIGTLPPGGDEPRVRMWAGDGASYLDQVTSADGDAETAGPAAVAFETGEVTVTDDVATDPRFEPFREAALSHGFRSVAAVPFVQGDVVHGVLAVYADRPDAFSQRERQAFELLGEMVGFAISATQDRRLIEADTYLELAFHIPDSESLLARLSTRLEARCRLLGSAKATESGTLHYVAVPKSAAAAVPDALPDAAPRRVRTDDDRAVFEIHCDDSVASLLRDSGVRPVDIVAEDGAVDAVVEAPQDADARTITDRIEAAYGDVSLVSKQERDHSEQLLETMCTDVIDQLTDRQRAALTAAYYGGYYDWPRGSTAEEIADSLGVSSPTLHQHLRRAQRTVMRTILDD